MNRLSANKPDAILQKCKNYLCHRSNVRDLWFSCPIILYYLIELYIKQIVARSKIMETVSEHDKCSDAYLG